jgi:hypothetical protein
MLCNRNMLVGMLATTLCAGAMSCGSSDGAEAAGQGAVTFTTWGEDYIEEELPAAPPAAEGIVDGWTVKYSKFLVVIRGVTIADSTGATAAQMSGSVLFDMHLPGSKDVVQFPGLPAKSWDRVSYEVGPCDSTTVAAPGVDPSDLAMMAAQGFSMHVAAEATRGSDKKTISWSFKEATRYRDCKAELDGKQVYGVVVTNGGNDQVELTIHGDHFFYDDLEAPTAQRRFDAIACADADHDGAVTLEELSAVSLLPEPNATDDWCKSRPAYKSGSQPVNDLGAFVRALSRTVGHYRGEGECISEKLAQ